MASVTVKPPLWFPGRNPAAFGLWEGCVFYLPAWNGAGHILYDISGNGYTATGVNWDGDEWVNSPELGRCVEHSKVDSDDSLLADFDGTEYDTLSVLFYGTTYNDTAARYSMLVNRTNNNGYTLRRENDGKITWFCYDDDGIQIVTSTQTIAGGRVAHIVGTLSKEVITLYIDGQYEVHAARTGSGIVSSGTTLNIAPGYWRFAPVAVWKRALDAGEVALLASDPFIMIRPPSLLPIYASAFSPAGAPPAGQPTVKRFANVPFCHGYQGRAA